MALPKWLSNPYVGLVALLVSVVGLGFGVYAYYASEQFRQLKYAVSPERSVLIDSAKASDFEIKFRGTPVTTDVTSVSITLWNAGNQSIRNVNILEPITITIGDGVHILEAKIIRSSRDIAGISLDNSKNMNGVVLPNWKILEHEDGAVIQIIYSGSSEEIVAVDGAIEGKREIEEFKLDVSQNVLQMRWIYGIMLAVIVVMQIWKLWRASRRNIYAIADAFMFLAIISMGLLLVFLPSIITVSLPVKF